MRHLPIAYEWGTNAIVRLLSIPVVRLFWYQFSWKENTVQVKVGIFLNNCFALKLFTTEYKSLNKKKKITFRRRTITLNWLFKFHVPISNSISIFSIDRKTHLNLYSRNSFFFFSNRFLFLFSAIKLTWFFFFWLEQIMCIAF